MPPYLPVLLICLTIAIAIIVVVATKVAARKRREALVQAAADFGWSYSETPPAELAVVRDKMPLFAKGRRRKMTSVMAGRLEDLGVYLFDYAYTTGSGKNQQRSRQTVVAVERPEAIWPTFVLRPEGFFFRLTELFGRKDIDFETHPIFSDNFALSGPNEDAIRAVFTPPVLAHFETVKPNFVIQATGPWLVLFRPRRRVDPTRLSALLEEAVEAVGAFDHA